MVLGPFAQAFVAGDRRAEPFLAADFRSHETRRARVRTARERTTHPDVIAALTAADAELPRSERRRQNIDALAAKGTVAVVTGQQVGLFLGPLYSVYKAASAIACAKALEAETGVRCVPVFWLQTEDHDFDEIDHCHVLDEQRQLVTLRLKHRPAPRVSVAYAPLADEVRPLLDELERCVGACDTLKLLRSHYRPGVTLARAFAGSMAELFADDGLILLDPRSPQLAQAALPIHHTALRNAHRISEVLVERARALEVSGFQTQVSVRPGAPLSFFHPDGATGPRYRLEPTEREGTFRFVGRDGEVTMAQLLNTQASAFSTSALLRPMLQDSWLPTAAIVGGPGEINYFAQTAPLYRAFELPQPMLVPRARFRVLDARTRSLLEKLQLSSADAELPHEALLEKVRPKRALAPLSPEQLEQALVNATDAVLQPMPIDSLGPDVADAVARTRGTIARAASRLAGRYRRALDLTDEVQTERVTRLQQVLAPKSEPQERVLCLAAVASSCGAVEFIRRVLAQLQPFAAAVQELRL